jgi:hypothetical protein
MQNFGEIRRLVVGMLGRGQTPLTHKGLETYDSAVNSRVLHQLSYSPLELIFRSFDQAGILMTTHARKRRAKLRPNDLANFSPIRPAVVLIFLS